VTKTFIFIISTFSNKNMLNLSIFEIARKPSIGLATILLILINFANPSLSKPDNWSYNISNNLRFDFKGCTKSDNDVICIGNFRSRSGEQSLHIGTGYTGGLSPKLISITDSRGNVSFADEVRVGENWIFTEKERSVGDVVLVEGIDYKTLFVFKDVSLPSLKIPLFSAQNDNYFGWASQFSVKVRNITVSITELK
jgi:hypothetical protein